MNAEQFVMIFIQKTKTKIKELKEDEIISIVSNIIHPKKYIKIRDKQKIVEDLQNETTSELEKYMSIFLYADIQPLKAKEEIKNFLHTSTRAYIHDACYMNLLEFYYKSNSNDLDEFLINMIADLYFRAKPNIDKGIKKGIFIQDLKNKKKKSK